MHSWIGWLARNPVAANLLMVLLVISGLIATTTILTLFRRVRARMLVATNGSSVRTSISRCCGSTT